VAVRAHIEGLQREIGMLKGELAESRSQRVAASAEADDGYDDAAIEKARREIEAESEKVRPPPPTPPPCPHLPDILRAGEGDRGDGAGPGQHGADR
jgi:hypothetical protein